MPMLPKKKLDQIREIIQRHVAWFIRRLFGDQYASSDVFDVPSDVETPSSLIELSFILGREESILKETEWQNFGWDDLSAAADRPLSPVERMQVEASELSAYSNYRRLGEEITNGVFRRLAAETTAAVSEEQIRGKIKDQIQVGIVANKKYTEVAKDLAESLKENQKNWSRVASTEMHQSRQLGIAHSIIQKIDIYEDSDGPESDVSVIVAPDACRDCRRIYLDSSTGHPKVFKLSHLLGNAGSNYQRPWRNNARPVVPPLHSNCYCRLRYVPPGWGWNDKGRFTLIDPKAAFPEVMKDEPLAKAIDQEAHSLLHASSATLPTEDYIHQITDPDEFVHLEKRLEKVRDMYIKDHDIYLKIDKLLNLARGRHFHLYMTTQGKDQEAPDAS